MPDDLEKQIKVLEQRLSFFEKDATYRGFYALNRIVNQQVDYLNKFNLEKEIGQNPKEDKVFDRAKSLWEGLKGLINDLASLKTELRLSDDDEEYDRKIKNKNITPESVSNVLGNSAGQHS